MSFVHLQVASSFSLLSSTISINGLVHKAKELGFKALALTDQNMMYGVVPFYKQCLKEGIKPIIGLTADVAVSDTESYPMVLLCENMQGYQNLMKISSSIGAKTPEGIPLKWLHSYHEGLIAISPGLKGEVESLLLADDKEQAVEKIRLYQDLFGSSSFYLGLQNHGLPEEEQLLSMILAVAKETGTEVVALNDVRCLEEGEHFALECLNAIRDGVKLDDEERVVLKSSDYYLKPREAMVDLFSDAPDALENTLKIAERCRVDIPFHQQLLPKYPLPEGVDALSELTKQCESGLHRKVDDVTDLYLNRLDYELNVIGDMGFSDYFLIVWDFMKFSRENGILTGPGRGSAAGSLVSYALDITDVDPLRHDLLFERFLNPERVTMPDIDIDFPDHRRDEVIDYVEGKYGSMHVAQIITFGTFAAKAALRDTGRVFGLNMKEQEQLSKLLPSKPGLTLEGAYQDSTALRDLIGGSDLHRRIFTVAKQIEGLPRHTSTHAAGVVISDEPLVKWVPIQGSPTGIHLTQFPMDTLEEIGLLKMDFLGLRNLSILERIVKSIQRGSKRTFKLSTISDQDEKTFELLSAGRTSGVFQLESDGMRSVLTRLKPSSFEDIVAVNALFRPGPMENIPMFIRRKHGEEVPHYPIPEIKPILEATYGVIVYQEQIMQIASKMAGFSLGEADLLRRAVSKKKKEVLDREREHFVSGALKKGYGEAAANDVYDLIVRFADYGFNRSHAVAYSKIAYQLAYLKAHYPAYFLSSLLTASVGNDGKIAHYIREARQTGIEILPPSINSGHFMFQVEGENRIRYSLGAIKGVGAAALKEITRARQDRPYADLFDFVIRVSLKVMNRGILENLILAGAFDEFGEDRAVLLASLDVAIEHAELIGPDDDLFADEEDFFPKPKTVEVEAMSLDTKLQFEKQVLGLYLSDHPVSSHRERFERHGLLPIADAKKGARVKIGAYLTAVKTIRTKKGEVMAFIEMGDETGDLEGVIFPNIYKRNMNLLKDGKVLILEGNMEERNDRLQLIVNTIGDASELNGPDGKRLFLKIGKGEDQESMLTHIKGIVAEHVGDTEVLIYFEEEKKTVKLPQGFNRRSADEAIGSLRKLLGNRNVVLQ
ncbi:DNA polymerase III subunit alpha [Rossellomorea sp. RS05]|uniref:DNA polymerase III subunit alpha n=1 Tax=Rossellomorea sp. RS05 TaxID=3149166 RepID=UPI003221D834